MPRPIPWFWVLLALALLLAPGPAGRFLLDLLGGVTLLLLLLPLLFGVAGLVGWQILRRRLRTCDVCGFTSLGAEVCPACGNPFAAHAPSPFLSDNEPARSRAEGGSSEIPAADATIDVEVVEVKDQGS
jgi:rRNA maturation protein Nop10